jgi:hypothetical protein
MFIARWITGRPTQRDRSIERSIGVVLGSALLMVFFATALAALSSAI